VLEKAGCDVSFPARLASLCCGLAFESKGFPRLADEKARELEAALLEASEGGRHPVLCDTSPCVQRMKATLDARLALHEPAELVHDRLMDRLRFERRAGTVALHVTCSTTKMGLEGSCAPWPRPARSAWSCRHRVLRLRRRQGLHDPRARRLGPRGLRAALPPGCERGYSNSRGCEIGLTMHAGLPYQSIVYLVDACTSPARRGGARAAGEAV